MSEEKAVVVGKAPTAMAKTKDMLQGPAFQEQLKMVLPSILTPERMVRVALTAMLKTPKIAECTPASITQCLLDAGSMGLEPDGRLAYLIPYGDKCTLIPSWIGLVTLARRSGEISNIFPCEVCENDFFAWKNGNVEHEIDWRKPRGECYAVYARVTYKDGSVDTETMSRDEIEKVRKSSKAATSGPWVQWWSEMAKKSVIKRLLKRTASSPELNNAIEMDDADYTVETTKRVEKALPDDFGAELGKQIGEGNKAGKEKKTPQVMDVKPEDVTGDTPFEG